MAAATGDGRWDVRGAGEDVEDLQVAWGLSGAAGALEWHGDAPGSSAPAADELVESGGRSRLRALRVALVARSPLRLPRSSGSPAPEFAMPLNGPAAGTLPGASPIGWDPFPQRRIRFDREVRTELVTRARGLVLTAVGCKIVGRIVWREGLMRRLLIATALFAGWAAFASADEIWLKDGRSIATTKPVVTKGRNALITTTDGVLLSVPLTRDRPGEDGRGEGACGRRRRPCRLRTS